MEKDLNKNCPSCGLLLTQIMETSSDFYRQYDFILKTLIELERKGAMELFAGDCPLEDTDAVLYAEQHYTVCHYAVPQLRSLLFCGSLHPGCAGLSAGGRHQEGKPGHPAVGPVWNLLFTEKRVKEMSTWTTQTTPGSIS